MDFGSFLDWAVLISLFILTLSLIITVYRVVRGPTLPDRILALDMLVSIAIGYIAVTGIKTGFDLYVDIAIALGLVGFLATVAFARFILATGLSDSDSAVREDIRLDRKLEGELEGEPKGELAAEAGGKE